MGGLAKILREKSSIVQGDQDGPRHIQLPEEILLDLPVAKYGLGGDVEGGRDEGVGGMSNDGNQSNGTESGGVSSESPHGGSARDGGWGGDPGGWSVDNINAGGWGAGDFESGAAYDGFSGSNGDGGFMGYSDAEFGASPTGNLSQPNSVDWGGRGWSVDNINANGWGAGDFESGAAYDGFGGGSDGFMGYSNVDFNAPAATPGMAFAGMGDAFGAYTPDGRLSGPAASEVDFDGTIGNDPLQGDLADFAPGPQQTMPSGMIDPDEALTSLATNITPAEVDLSLGFEEEPELVDDPGFFDHLGQVQAAPLGATIPAPMEVAPIPAANPVRAMARMAVTENGIGYARRGNEKGLLGAAGTALSRADIGYGKNSKAWAGKTYDGIFDPYDVVDQIMAPRQYSGMTVPGSKIGTPNKTKIERADQFLDQHPEIYGMMADLYTGAVPNPAKGHINLDGPDQYGRTGKNYTDLGGQRAWGGTTASRAATAAREAGFGQISPDDNPAFNVPAGPAPGVFNDAPLPAAPRPSDLSLDRRADLNIDIDPAEVDMTGVFTGPIATGVAQAPVENGWGFSDMFGMGAQAKTFEDQAPALANQAAYDSMPVSVEDPSIKEALASMPVNAQKVEETTPGISWGDIGSMLATGFGNLFTTEQPAIAYETPGPIEEQEERTRAAQRGVPSLVDFQGDLEATFPSLTPEQAMGQFSTRDFGTMPGARSGLVGSGATFGGRGPALTGYESMGLPSGRPGSRMTNDPSVWEGWDRREGPIEVDAPPAGALVAGGGVYGTAPDKKSPSTGSARPSGSRSAPKGTAVATNEVYGPVMPGMIPGTDRYPTSGVIAQPSTAFHEKVAERAGGALAGMALGAVHPGLSLANTLSGLFGGPSTGGLFANSTPGMDLSRGRFDNWDDGGREQERPRTSQVAAKDDKKDDKKKDKKEPERWTPPDYGDDYASLYDRRYLGPDDDPRSYGYRRERKYFTAAQGGRVNPGEPSRSGLSRARSKRTA